MPRAKREVEPRAWERQLYETSESWESFRAYLDLGNDRTLAAAAEKVGRPETALQKWSSKHKWTARIVEFDNWMATAEDEAKRKVRVSDAAWWERHRLRLLRKTARIYMHMLERGHEIINLPIVSQKTKNGSNVISIVANVPHTAGTTMIRTATEMMLALHAEATADLTGFDPSTATPEECKEYVDAQEARRKAAREPAGHGD